MVVPARDAWVAMAQKVLHGGEVDALLQEMCCGPSTEAMAAGARCINACRFQPASHHAEYASGGQRLGFMAANTVGRGWDELREHRCVRVSGADGSQILHQHSSQRPVAGNGADAAVLLMEHQHRLGRDSEVSAAETCDGADAGRGEGEHSDDGFISMHEHRQRWRLCRLQRVEVPEQSECVGV